MSTPLLAIAADLSAPPSSPASFRDVSLISSIRGYEVVAVVEEGTVLARDAYSIWFKRYGLYDYISDLLLPYEVPKVNVKITGGAQGRLTTANLTLVLELIRDYR